MTTTIDVPELARISSSDLLRDFTNERRRNQRRLERAQLKLAGLQALKKDLQPYLQPGDYEHIEDRLQREVRQRSEKESELSRLCWEERYRQRHGDERFEKMQAEHDELFKRMKGAANQSTSG
jgi:hypothetical protein